MILPRAQLAVTTRLQAFAARRGWSALEERCRARAFRCELATTPDSVFELVRREQMAADLAAVRAEDRLDGAPNDLDDADEDCEMSHG